MPSQPSPAIPQQAITDAIVAANLYRRDVLADNGGDLRDGEKAAVLALCRELRGQLIAPLDLILANSRKGVGTDGYPTQHNTP